jgi:2-iminobutanoate/2-iminopropanoate deaminase
LSRIAIRPDGIPVLGIYTPAFKVSNGELIVTAGIVGVDAEGRTVGVGDAAAQARQAIANLRAVLEAAGASLDDVIHLRVFSTDMRNRDAINQERKRAFKEPLPASTHVQISRLVREDWLLEIEATAFVPSSP